MFKHILIPVDGTVFSGRAIETGVRFAKSLDARITGFIAEPGFQMPVNRSFEPLSAHLERAQSHAHSVLKRIGDCASAEGVPFDADFVESSDVAEAIVDAAARHHCDLIIMASHGRHGIEKLLHHNAAAGVVSHAIIPVLVLH